LVRRILRALQRSALTPHLRTLRAQAGAAGSGGVFVVSGLWRIVAVSFDAFLAALEREWRERASSPPPGLPPAAAWALRAVARLSSAGAGLASFAQRATAAHARLATRFDARAARLAVPAVTSE
jgi:hypothetical protein